MRQVSAFEEQDLSDDDDEGEDSHMDADTTKKNIQKLIDEVTKKEEKWTREQDEELVRLVSKFRVEQIQIVHKLLNDFIDHLKKTVPVE